MKSAIYMAPWAERMPDGTLREYGPSPQTYTRKVGEHRQWGWQPNKEARKADADAIRSLLMSNPETIPAGELAAGTAVYLNGHSVRWTARHLGKSRRTIRVQLERLAQRCN